MSSYKCDTQQYYIESLGQNKYRLVTLKTHKMLMPKNYMTNMA